MIPVFSEHFFQDNSCKINTRNIHEKSPETIYPGRVTYDGRKDEKQN